MTFARTGGSGCEIQIGSEACAGVAFEPENIPLDIYLLFDQTGSMCSCVDPPRIGNPCPDPTCKKTRIDAIREAMNQFLADPKSAGIGMGIGYFGQAPIGSASCNANSFSRPDLGIELLPGAASSLARSLASVSPTGETSTGAAIRGACSYAQSWQKTQPTHKVVMLLVTDGLPEAPVSCPQSGCCPTIEDAVAASRDCRARELPVDTYVLGVGPYLENLTKIAEAGGTQQAYLVGSGDVTTEVLSALNAIRGDASIPCRFALPPPPAGQALAPDKVNIAYADLSCQGTLFSRVSEESACAASGGWYYDNSVAPKNVMLCPATCDRVSVPGGQLLYSVGCSSVVVVQ